MNAPRPKLDFVRRAVEAHLQTEPAPPSAGPVYAAVRRAGRLLGEAWAEEGDAWPARAARAAARAIAAAGEDGASADTIELCLTFGYRILALDGDLGALANVHRGLRGLEVRAAGRELRLSPTAAIARNLSPRKALERFALELGGRSPQALAGTVTARWFEGRSLLVNAAHPHGAVPLFRGARLVDPREVTPAAVQQLVLGAGAWLFGQLTEEGRLSYKYWPSRGTYSPANNLIRQLMATVALGRFAAFTGDPRHHELAARNLAWNLDRYARREGELAYVELNGKVKLGAIALAALAVVESPERARHADLEAGFRRALDHLWEDSGRFRTFLKPAERTDNENFYPGEALLLWAALEEREPDPARYQRFLKSFEHYRAWHRSERNPAFVPWHTQAYWLAWQQHRLPALGEMIFEMNDWLLSIQQWDCASYPDLRGRFYDPRRPQFGPPHASSTGVYLEGLADAWSLARAVDDDDREEVYRLGIIRGLRSVLQLQLKDDTDLFYVSKRDRVRGGIRTTVYDNAIRIDNVQHNLMAVLKVLERFSASDY